MKNHVLIFGGGLINKGAQAMTFIAVNEAKHLIPNAEITLALEPRSKGIKDLTNIIDDLIFVDIKNKNK